MGSSCGCSRTHPLEETKIGKKYGRLTVLRCSVNRRHRSVVWECVCDCGNMTEAASNQLTSGEKMSCGCLPPGRSAKSGITGIYYSEKKDLWRAEIRFEGAQYYLGSFKDKNEAIRVRKIAEEKRHAQIFLEWYRAGHPQWRQYWECRKRQ